MQQWRRYIPAFFLVVLALVTFGIWLRVFATTPPATLTVAFLNVGQGDAIYIQSPTGADVLIDGGRGGAVLEELPRVMRAGDRSLDAIVATHPDADHIGGLIDVAMRYEVGAYVSPGIEKPTITAQRIEEVVDEERTPRYIARRGMRLDLGGGAVLDVLSPDGEALLYADKDSNEGSVVMLLSYASSTVLFMADASSKIEARLVTLYGEALDADILKVGHHGSRFSTSADFLRATSPDVAVVSVGRNSYGHPTLQVLSRLAAQNVQTLRTDEEGTIVFTSRGGEWERAN